MIFTFFRPYEFWSDLYGSETLILMKFEWTRGIWNKACVTIAGESKYAYATYKGVVKDIYEIHSWVPAGTQEYFSRLLDPERLKNARWEVVGKKASNKVRELYVGKILKKKKLWRPFCASGL